MEKWMVVLVAAGFLIPYGTVLAVTGNIHKVCNKGTCQRFSPTAAILSSAPAPTAWKSPSSSTLRITCMAWSPMK